VEGCRVGGPSRVRATINNAMYLTCEVSFDFPLSFLYFKIRRDCLLKIASLVSSTSKFEIAPTGPTPQRAATVDCRGVGVCAATDVLAYFMPPYHGTVVAVVHVQTGCAIRQYRYNIRLGSGHTAPAAAPPTPQPHGHRFGDADGHRFGKPYTMITKSHLDRAPATICDPVGNTKQRRSTALLILWCNRSREPSSMTLRTVCQRTMAVTDCARDRNLAPPRAACRRPSPD
jgi:hypothetical protein